MVKEGARNKEANLAHSHLYKTGGTLVGTFQRIDIPILRQFDQYNYVLFTGGQLVCRRCCLYLGCRVLAWAPQTRGMTLLLRTCAGA